MHPLTGRKQTTEHVEKRAASCRKKWAREPRPLLDTKAKLLKKIIVADSGCWIWTGAVFKKKYGSYGQLRMGRWSNNKLRRAHCVSYELFVGAIPKGLEIDHLCNDTLCINPEHLEAVSHRENMRRGKLGRTRNFTP